MKTAKRNGLASAGWRVGSTHDFLGLSAEEQLYIEIKLRLSNALRVLRKKRGVTQVALANRIGSSQSRIAKAEAADPSVAIDLLVKALISIGASRNDLAEVFGASS